METYDLLLSDSKTAVLVIIERKDMKTCRLKVFPDKAIKFSVPKATPSDWISKYLDSKTRWISEKLNTFEQTRGYAATTDIRNAGSIRFLGEDLMFAISESKKPSVLIEGKSLRILTPNINDQDSIKKQFEKWWRTESLKHLNAHLDKLYPIVEKYKISRPKAVLRKMKTLWGSCSANRGVITFNQYLTKAKPALIEYVVLHELVHFLYPNHSKQFYSFLSNYMPDWEVRKRILDQDVVHGL